MPATVVPAIIASLFSLNTPVTIIIKDDIIVTMGNIFFTAPINIGSPSYIIHTLNKCATLPLAQKYI
jgi:hypothetical protein